METISDFRSDTAWTQYTDAVFDYEPTLGLKHATRMNSSLTVLRDALHAWTEMVIPVEFTYVNKKKMI